MKNLSDLDMEDYTKTKTSMIKELKEQWLETADMGDIFEYAGEKLEEWYSTRSDWELEQYYEDNILPWKDDEEVESFGKWQNNPEY